jgi:diguanylate cyclase (GGDEF)-like protein
MQLPLALNAIGGSALVVALIFADYIRKYDTRRTRKAVFCGILALVFVLMMSALAALLCGRNPDNYICRIAGFFPAKIIWPCMTAALLYCYFFIIQTDTRLDSLTGIGNRCSFNEFTDRLSRHKSGESWTIVMIDMDHFKRINDALGHQEGDNALRDMAEIIKSCVTGSDFAARYGGDEFVLATKEKSMASLMGQIQAAINRQNEQHTRPFTIEISYGYDVFTADGARPIEEFLNHIDSLMYKQKEERRRAGDRQGAAS